MKALTLWQPWASFMVAVPKPPKTIETRSWYTSHRGQLVIHAAKKTPRDALERFVRDSRLATLVLLHLRPPGSDASVREVLRSLPYGAVVGSVIVTDCVAATRDLPGDSGAERLLGVYGAGRFGILTRTPARLRNPVAWKGHQRLWEFPDEEWPGARLVDGVPVPAAAS